MYNRVIMEHFLKPRNVGSLEGAYQGQGLNPDCNDTVTITLSVSDGRVEEARFASKGCAGAIACSSATTEMLIGSTLEDAKNFSAEALSEYLGGIPDAKMGCAEMAANAAREAIKAALSI
jgi:NifU-like protein involved in Fe-S cluster formation